MRQVQEVDQVQLAHIGTKLDSVEQLLSDVLPKVATALERIARTEERQLVANARLKEIERREEDQRKESEAIRLDVAELRAEVRQNTGARGHAATLVWVIVGAVVTSLGVWWRSTWEG